MEAPASVDGEKSRIDNCKVSHLKSRPDYLPQIDALRAFSVIAVVYQHYGNPAVNQVLRPGIFGVRLFFVISGFLITGILLRARLQAAVAHTTRSSVLRAFYARRFLRIFPAYYFTLFGAAALALPTVRESFVWHVSYMSNYYYARLGIWEGPVSHFWSLAVEEQFYLIWPFVILFTPRRYLLGVLISTLFVGPLTRFWLITSTANTVTMSVPLPSCVDSLGSGAILAWIWQADPVVAPRARSLPKLALWFGVVGGAALLGLHLLDTGWRIRLALTDTAGALMFVGIVDFTARGVPGRLGRILEARPIVYIGTISYGVYLYHNFIAVLARSEESYRLRLHFPEGGGTLPFLYALAVTLLLATISWHVIERPLNRLKKHFAYASAKRLTAAPSHIAASDTHSTEGRFAPSQSSSALAGHRDGRA
jgi:peptidoglycan/LPS O-acetylase OafA/YrhL